MLEPEGGYLTAASQEFQHKNVVAPARKVVPWAKVTAKASLVKTKCARDLAWILWQARVTEAEDKQ